MGAVLRPAGRPSSPPALLHLEVTGMNLVIVESPAKAKTIEKYLGKDYKVLASFGHIRDLPSKNGSVDPENDFEMTWSVDTQSKKRIKDIETALQNSDKLILATDPDREGEAISWHLLDVLSKKKKNKLKEKTLNALSLMRLQKSLSQTRLPIHVSSIWNWLRPISPAVHLTILWASHSLLSCGVSYQVRVLRAAYNLSRYA